MKSTTKRRVAVTGLGAVTNVGIDAPTTWKSLVEGRSGVSTLTAFEQDDQWSVRIAGEVRGWDPTGAIDAHLLKRMDRFCALGMCAADEAARDCGFDFQSSDPYHQGVVIGSGVGGIHTIEVGHAKLLKAGPRKMSPFIVPKLMVNACAGNVSIRHKLRGPNSVTSTACATGAHAIGTAFYLIQRGDADVMFAGGTEAAVTPLCVGSFAAMKALSTRNDEPAKASRPFDRDRDGFVLAEGAAILILESLDHAKARGATIYAELLGFGSSGDGYHIAAPDPQGIGARHAMEAALADGDVALDRIDYINAHGTSTLLGDAAEVKAVEALFGDHARALAMSSTKSMTGHALGAAGGIESMAVVLSIRDGIVPPTINLEKPDEGCDLNLVPNEAQERRVRYALNNSFGFGGHNVTLLFGAYDGD